jgi:hypothetical protein
MTTNTIEISSETRTATVAVAVYIKARRRTARTVAGQAALSMLHAWNTASACHAFKNLQVAADETLLYAAASVRS